MKTEQIGAVCNWYGGLWVAEIDGKYYWEIENCTGIIWEGAEEIPKHLYDALIAFNKGEEG